MPGPAILLIGTLDTKGTEILFVRDLLRMAGLPVIVLDAGVQPHAPPGGGDRGASLSCGRYQSRLRAAGWQPWRTR